MFQIKKGNAVSLDDLSKLHWENIVRKKLIFSNGAMPYELDSIIRRVEKVRTVSSRKQLVFMNDLVARGYELLKKIIVGNPLELHRLGNALLKKVNNGTYPKITYRTKKTQPKEFGDYILEIFNYDLFVDKKRFWNAYELSKQLGVDVCIYCNRNYTYTLTRGRNYYVRPEFDHFLPKSRYPFFAISFYNLIPSCHICNSNLKRDIDFTTSTNLHPYLNSLDETLKFTIEFVRKTKYSTNDIKTKFGVMFFLDKIDNFTIKLVNRNLSTPTALVRKAINNCNTFKLNDLYNCHKDFITEMVSNTIIYSDSKINELFKDFGGRLFSSRDDVIRHITKNYHLDSDMPKRPFSKLVKDIHKEFGLKY